MEGKSIYLMISGFMNYLSNTDYFIVNVYSESFIITIHSIYHKIIMIRISVILCKS
jgi:hypothetical protein